ncbi:MAG: hypothetical protein IKY86_00530 [Clostridia bacterium]|nr:hypothetical protein [Clostridia bacterium]
MKRSIAVLLAVLLLTLSACGGDPPTRRELAQTETGWDVTYMDKAKEYVPPEGLTLVVHPKEGRILHFSIRNDRNEVWYGNYADDGQMQALVNGEWYVIPNAETPTSGGASFTMVGGPIQIRPGKTLGTSFVPGNFPPGQYRRIWNGVALPFEILP